MNWDVLVIGGGAAGMIAAGTASERGLRTVLLEKNDRLGKKLMITGKGRCNVTNHCGVSEAISSVTKNGRFLFGAFSKFSPEDTMAFFEKLGVPLKTERGNRVFPQSDQAGDIVGALKTYLHRSGVTVICDEVKSLLIKDGNLIGAKSAGESYTAANVIVTCGGLSYPSTGSTGDGYRLARQAGHSVVPPVASLVPLETEEGDCAEMQGLSLKNCAITVTDTKTKKEVYSDFGELLFTHFGLSGPVILSASAHMREMEKDRYEISLDVKPALSEEKLEERLMRDLSENRNRDLINSLSALLPAKMIESFVRASGIDPRKKCNSITREDRKVLVQLLKHRHFTVKGFRPISEAIITSGGVDVREINPATMESKLLPGLFFAGEVLDTDAYTGGFNLQIAFSTGRLSGNSVKGGKV